MTILTVHCVNVLYLNKDNMYTLPVQCVTHYALRNWPNYSATQLIIKS